MMAQATPSKCPRSRRHVSKEGKQLIEGASATIRPLEFRVL